ncbi:MAG: GDSL-type esterase/lipase family protein [Propionibacteriales bacterium]|nr:GDSL-type esterase/lipase family protein [Propionibacteriales bacterium]
MPVSASAASGGIARPSRLGQLAARPRAVVIAAFTLLALVAGVAYLGMADRQPPLTSDGFPMAQPVAAAGAQALTFAVVGDSITADHAFPSQVARRIVGERSWAAFAQTPGTAFVGGWARGGATTAEMLAGFEPVDADVLVMIAGTNDIHAGVPFEQIGANMRSIVDVADLPRVIVSSVPPRNDFRERTLAYNAWLHDFVAEQGWGWIDGARGLRDDNRPGMYAEGLTYDGIHPSRAGAKILGAAVLGALGTQPTAQDTLVEIP